jgi:hypothetical protein
MRAPDGGVPAILLEVDRVTEPVDDLVPKLRRYTEWFELLAPKAEPWREAGRTELTTRVVEERLDAYVTTLMDAPG